jgi:hypothetical protein
MFKSIYQGNGKQSCVKATFGALLSRMLFPTHIPAVRSSSSHCCGSMARLRCTCITTVHVSVGLRNCTSDHFALTKTLINTKMPIILPACP